MVALDWHIEVQTKATPSPKRMPARLVSGVRIEVDHFGRFDPALGIRDPGSRI